MTDHGLYQLRYPIGEFKRPTNISKNQLNEWIDVLDQLPNRLEKLVIGLNDTQLDTKYRPEGWTIRQVVHHIADSHHHSYIRFKWAMTEQNPLIKAYYEQYWAELFDSKSAPIQMSLLHIKAVHAKLVYFLKGLSSQDFERSFIHPEGNMEVQLKVQTGIYAWHSQHHYAHIENLIKSKNW